MEEGYTNYCNLNERKCHRISFEGKSAGPFNVGSFLFKARPYLVTNFSPGSLKV